MGKRPFSVAALVLTALVVRAVPATAADIFAQLFPLTGEVRLLNRDEEPIPFVYYSITSAGGALNGADGVWRSVSDHYDASGSGLVDPDHNWFELADDAVELTEAVFTGPGGSLPATRAVSLGEIWDPFAVPFPDLVFDVQDDSGPIPVTVELALDGDYSANQIVDQADFVLWRKYLNSITMLIPDGDLNGIVDLDDYKLFQENFGITLPLPPYLSGSGAGSSLRSQAGVVPEPSAAILCFLGLGSWLAAPRRLRGPGGSRIRKNSVRCAIR